MGAAVILVAGVAAAAILDFGVFRDRQAAKGRRSLARGSADPASRNRGRARLPSQRPSPFLPVDPSCQRTARLTDAADRPDAPVIDDSEPSGATANTLMASEPESSV